MARIKSTELTEKQANVMFAYILRGTTRGAAEALGDTSARSIKAHLDVCVRKLDADDARDLLRAALDAGLVTVTVNGKDIRTLEWAA